MSKLVVALVGRPNVGKSTLFNRLAGQRLAVVDDRPGTTRDRLVAEAEWRGIAFDVVDTGGIDPTGGTDSRSPNIVWGSECWDKTRMPNLTVSAVAQAPKITVFVRVPLRLFPDSRPATSCLA